MTDRLNLFLSLTILAATSAMMTVAAFAWAGNGAMIWSELRFADLAGCFGF